MAITRRTAQLHCRTCLSDLLANGDGEAYDMDDNPELINWLERLLPLVSLYRGEDQADYPHLVCTTCYAKLRDFNTFYSSVCTATDVLDRIFDENVNKSLTTTIETLEEHNQSSNDLMRDEYTNGTSSTTLEIEVLSNSDGESTDTCSETDERLHPAADKITRSSQLSKPTKTQPQKQQPLKQQKQQEQSQRQQPQQQQQLKTNGKLKDYEHVIVPRQTAAQNKTEKTTIEYIVPLPTVINRKSYKCSKCERKFLDKYSCIMHIRSCQLLGHTDECFECEICHKNYQKIGHLNRHKLTEHADLCPLKCEYAGCNFIFRRNAYRQRHYEMFHVNEVKKAQIVESSPSIQSTALNDECTKAVQILLDDDAMKMSTTAESLTAEEFVNEDGNHVSQPEPQQQSQHTNIEMLVDSGDLNEYKDDAAGADDADEDDDLLMNTEMLLTSVTKPYRGNCPICHEQFNLGKDLRTHISNEHPDKLKFKCTICDKRFLYQAYLNSHLTSAHGERKTPCTSCPKMFKTNAELKRHISHVHHGVRPFGCRFCTAKFGVRASRDRHELTHTGEKPFACDLCDRTFSYAHSVRKHMESHERGRLKQAEI